MLYVLLFLSAVLGGTAFLLVSSTSIIRRIDARLDARDRALAVANRVFEEILNDETPEADSPHDLDGADIESIAGSSEFGIPAGKISVAEISSRVNPNTIERTILERTPMGFLFRPGYGVDELQRIRYEAGLSTEIGSRYDPVFSLSDAPELFSGYGLFNLNVTDELVIESIAANRTGDEAYGAELRSRIQTLRREFRIAGPADLSELLFPYEEELRRLLHTAPVWNVNFLPEPILGALLSHPGFGIQNAEATTQLLIDLRNTREIGPDELPELLGSEASPRLFAYLGAQSWFWRVSIESERYESEFVFAMLPAFEADRRSGTLIARDLHVKQDIRGVDNE